MSLLPAPVVKRTLAWSAVVLALAVVFASWLQPDLVFDLSTRLWSCFG